MSNAGACCDNKIWSDEQQAGWTEAVINEMTETEKTVYVSDDSVYIGVEDLSN